MAQRCRATSVPKQRKSRVTLYINTESDDDREVIAFILAYGLHKPMLHFWRDGHVTAWDKQVTPFGAKYVRIAEW